MACILMAQCGHHGAKEADTTSSSSVVDLLRGFSHDSLQIVQAASIALMTMLKLLIGGGRWRNPLMTLMRALQALQPVQMLQFARDCLHARRTSHLSALLGNCPAAQGPDMPTDLCS